jgi:hypothetical protein
MIHSGERSMSSATRVSAAIPVARRRCATALARAFSSP